MSLSKEVNDLLSEENMDKLFDWIRELSNSKSTNIKNILKWSSPRDFERIEKAIIMHYKKGKIGSAEDVEVFVDKKYDAETYR